VTDDRGMTVAIASLLGEQIPRSLLCCALSKSKLLIL
jgi:hypothetical protein